MTRLLTRPQHKLKAARESQSRATTVFRDFVRQLEKLDVKPSKQPRGAAR